MWPVSGERPRMRLQPAADTDIRDTGVGFLPRRCLENQIAETSDRYVDTLKTRNQVLEQELAAQRNRNPQTKYVSSQALIFRGED